MKSLLCVLAVLIGLMTHESFADTPIPYQWGKYKAVDYEGKKQVIIVDWFSAEGKRRLERSHYKNDFYELAHMYQPQINPVYAGIATSVIILNALRLPKHRVPSQAELEIRQPKALGGETLPFPAFSQSTLLTPDTDKIKDRKLIGLRNVTPENENDKKQFKPGTSLSDLKGILAVYGAEAEISYANQSADNSAKLFRETVKRVLKDDTRFLLANFKGDVLGATTGGTISPIGAYDEDSDSLLILDVTGHKNPWYWVPLNAFYGAMNTQYDGNFRGYAVVWDK